MSADGEMPGIVTQTIIDLLPTVNAGFNWDIITERYDSDPTGTAMSLHFTDDSGAEPVEEVTLGIKEGPEIAVIEELTDDWNYIGAIVTYQDYGLRILDPDDPMDPDRARYAHGGVTIHPAEDKSKERTWLVVSNVLDIMLESVIYEQQQDGQDSAQDDATDATDAEAR